MKLDNIELQVQDWEKMAKWYTEVLGLKILAKENKDKFALLGNGQGVKIGLFQVSTTAIRPNGRITPYWRVENIDKMVKELETKGVKFPKGIEKPHWGKQAEFSDPEGNRHFLYQENIEY